MRSSSDPLEQDAVVCQTPPGIRYKVRLFGPFSILLDNQPLGEPGWRRSKAKTLLKWFLLNPGQFFSAGQLRKLCWPDIERVTSTKNLHVAIHYLRRLLEPDLASGQESRFIHRNGDNFYWLELDESWWIDIQDIQRLSSAAREAERRSDLLAAITCYRELIDYYTLGFLPEEVYEDIFSPYRRQYDRAYALALEKLIELCTQASTFDEVLTYALHALSLDPYSEIAVKAIVNVYFKRGNVTKAIHTLDSFQTVLKQELRADPDEEMLLLRENILQLS